jgi:hypothetical protein
MVRNWRLKNTSPFWRLALKMGYLSLISVSLKPGLILTHPAGFVL